jgi:hypothetical protein
MNPDMISKNILLLTKKKKKFGKTSVTMKDSVLVFPKQVSIGMERMTITIIN